MTNSEKASCELMDIVKVLVAQRFHLVEFYVGKCNLPMAARERLGNVEVAIKEAIREIKAAIAEVQA